MTRELHEPTICEDELRPTHLEVDLARIRENYRALARHVGPARVMPVLKANAYGHGLALFGRYDDGRALILLLHDDPIVSDPDPQFLADSIGELMETLRSV